MIATCMASREERTRPMPADVLIPDPAATFTHAVTIRVGPRRVWPWIAQLGAGRGGWYAFDALTNGGRPSADIILPAFQEVRAGDIVPALPGDTHAFVTAAARPSHELVLTVPGHGGVVMTWELLLEHAARGRTRLVSRARLGPTWPAPTAPGGPVLVTRFHPLLRGLPRPALLRAAHIGHRLLAAGMLRGVKRRAERALEGAPVGDAVRGGFLDRLMPRAAVAERGSAHVATRRG